MLKNNYLKVFLLAMVAICAACEKNYDTIQTTDKAIIESYIKTNNVTGMTVDASGFYYKIAQAGSSTVLKNSDSVFYDFDIKGLNGTVYQNFKPFRPNQNFVGYVTPDPFRKVMLQLGRGGSAQLIIPSYLAFGKNGSGNIPSNEVILVDLTVLPYAKRHVLDDDLISKYNVQNNLGLTKDANTRCYYKVTTPGTGSDAIGPYSVIVANYTLRSLDGVQIQSITDGTFSSRLDQLYKGWREMLPGRLTAGGKMRLIIPSDKAGATSLEPLDFEIEIIKVTNE